MRPLTVKDQFGWGRQRRLPHRQPPKALTIMALAARTADHLMVAAKFG